VPEPTVSLIVLNWNGKRHLASVLSSLTRLDYPPDKLELIVADNGSTDGSVDFVRREFPAVRLIEFKQNLGFAAANDVAAEQAQGEWVGFLNNDMWVEPTWLRGMISALGDHPEAACLASRIKNWDGSALDFIGGGVNYQGHGFQVDYGARESARDVERQVLFACGGAMLIQRGLFLEVGGFDRDFFAFFEDVDLGWRLNVMGHEVWYTPRATAFHRHHGTADRIDSRKLRVLYERNALAAIYKCWDDSHLARALPAAMLLLNERALGLAQLDQRPFRMGPDIAVDAKEASPAPQRPFAYDPAQIFSESLRDRARRVLRQQGIGTALRKAVRHLRWRVEGAIVTVAVRVLGILLPDMAMLPGITLSHFVALSQFGHSLEGLQDKRNYVQEHRHRTDAEILPLLEDPFFANYSNPRYLRFYAYLNRALGLDRIFGAESP